MNEVAAAGARIVAEIRHSILPSMVVDETLMEQNISEMPALANSFGVALRPHIKTHKTPQIALRRSRTARVGITCAKLGEAEVMVDGGVHDMLMAYPVVTEIKINRLLALMERARMIVALDSLEAAEALSAAMSKHDRSLDVYVEVNTGQNRAGQLAGDDAVKLASISPGCRVSTCRGHDPRGSRRTSAGRTRSPKARARPARSPGRDGGGASAGRAVGSPSQRRLDPRLRCTRRRVGGITEMRPGTYVFRDNTGFRTAHRPDRCAARVVSHRGQPSRAGSAIVDAGSKTLALDNSPSHPGHGYIVGPPGRAHRPPQRGARRRRVARRRPGLHVGERVEIIPNHICPSVNLTDELNIVRDGQVIDHWPVAARGKVR